MTRSDDEDLIEESERLANLAGVGGVHHLVLQGAAEHGVVPDDSSGSQLLHRGSLL